MGTQVVVAQPGNHWLAGLVGIGSTLTLVVLSNLFEEIIEVRFPFIAPVLFRASPS